jgi:chemotaxis signal transduction protein
MNDSTKIAGRLSMPKASPSRTRNRAEQLLAARAERLSQEVDPEDSRAELDWLTFWVSKQLFAIPLAQADSVVRLDKIVALPGAPSYVPGLVRVQRRFILLVDLRELLFGDGHGISDVTKIVATRTGDGVLGLGVTDLHDVLPLAEAQIAAAHVAQDGLSRAVFIGDESVALLDLSALGRDPRLTTIVKLDRVETRAVPRAG